MTKQQAFEKAIKGKEYKTFDFALPQYWVDKMTKGWAYDKITSNFVWLYDKHSSLSGRPFPITDEGEAILSLEAIY